jgi:hypothetical protein
VVKKGSTQPRLVLKQPKDLTPCSRTRPKGELDLICVMHTGLSFIGVLMHTFDLLCVFK